MKFRSRKTMTIDDAVGILQQDVEMTKQEINNSLFDCYEKDYISAVELLIGYIHTFADMGLIDMNEKHMVL